MATPANRVPVRIARGSKANLDTAIAAGDLKEGEICYATDENGIYVIEGGTLTQAGADLATTSIDALSDVDTTTAAPTDGQVLIWNNVDSEWQPNDLSIDALSDVDTTTAAPTGGQALVWNNSVSQWEPGGVSGEIEWTLTANGTTDYIFAGAGFAGTETDPAIYVMRGQTYKFTNGMGAHPFQIQSTQGTSGTAYNDGITNNAVSNGTLTWEVRMDAPSTLYYQCTAHADMNGTIYVLDEGSAVASIDNLSDVDTSTVAPTDGQALVWDNAAQKWEPGTISGGGGTSLPSAQDGEALIYENGQWVAGPVIGGVDYTPSSGDANFNDVSLLLLANGSNGSTTFTDSSSNSLSLTASGGVEISTAQYKFGGSSAYFDGLDTIAAPSSSNFAFGTGDFTVECWYRPNSRISGNARIWSFGATEWASNDVFILNDRENSNNTKFAVYVYAFSTSAVLASTTSVTDGTWYHLAVVRSGNTLSLFVDGVEEDTYTSSGSVSSSASIPFYIGARASGSSLDGYIDDLRVTKGVARYTAAFTPPTAELPTTGASNIVIPYSIDKLDDVDTSTVAPTDGQALVWDNANSKWEPGTISGGGGTTLPSAQDGEALIYENGAWVAGPVIGGVNYVTGAGSPTYTAPTGFALWSDTFTIEPASQSSTVILTNGDRTAEQTGGTVERNAVSTSTKSTGKWYWEIVTDVVSIDSVVGITQNPANGFPGDSNTGGIGFYYSGSIFNNSGATVSSGLFFATGDTLMLALDADAKKLWFGKNGTWHNSGDPAAGTGAVATNWTGTPDWYFACRFKGTGGEKYTVSSGASTVIPYSIDKLDDVDTSTVAPTDGQALLWDAANSKWEPGTVSGGGGGMSRAQATAITLVFS